MTWDRRTDFSRVGERDEEMGSTVPGLSARLGKKSLESCFNDQLNARAWSYAEETKSKVSSRLK